MENYFQVRDLEVSFKTFEGIKNVVDLAELSIQEGETFGLVGESGAGKSVLAYSLLKLLSSPPAIIRGGEVLLGGENLLTKSEAEMRQIRGNKIAMIFQDPMSSLNPVFTIGDQLRNVIRKNRKLSGRALKEEILRMLNLVQLPDPIQIANKYPHELSGGQRQRVIIALALSCNPNFLIADEPTRNLDVTIQAGILKLIVELQDRMKMTVLYIANNPALVYSICDKMGVFHCGRVVETGTVSEVMGNPMHPYTSLLLYAIPKDVDLTTRSDSTAIKKYQSQHAGCRFIDHCTRALQDCQVQKPGLRRVDGNHYVACHVLDG